MPRPLHHLPPATHTNGLAWSNGIRWWMASCGVMSSGDPRPLTHLLLMELLVLLLEPLDAVVEVHDLNAAAGAAVTSVARHLQVQKTQGYSSATVAGTR